MYITSIDFSANPLNDENFHPQPIHFSLSQVHSMGFKNTSDVRDLARSLEQDQSVKVDWKSWRHDEQTHCGSVRMKVRRKNLPNYESTMTWKYDRLDDLDAAELLPIPEDENSKVLHLLNSAQRAKFWQCVDLKADAFNIVSVVLDRFELEPREPNALDRLILESQLAWEWYQAFPSMEAAEAALDAQPNLTDVAVGLLAVLGCRCGLFGEEAALYRVLVDPEG